MILVTGGLGFIGSHTVRTLVEMGETCVLVQRREPPPGAQFDDQRLRVERGDISDLKALMDIGARHRITGIVHLAGSVPWPPTPNDPVGGARTALDGLLNVLYAAHEWDVARMSVMSTIGVYVGARAEGALDEELALPMRSYHAIPAFKKIGELLTDYLVDSTGIELINCRLAAIWGPGGRPASPFFAAPQLIQAAARGTTLDLSPLAMPVFAEDSIDMCYVKDCARAIALLQLADRLNYRTYNVGSGRATTNAEVIEAIAKALPDARIKLPSGGSGPKNHLDISRIQQDTGYRPDYDTDRAVSEYIRWVRQNAT